MHKGGLKPHSFHVISQWEIVNMQPGDAGHYSRHAKMQYLLILQVSKYCFLALQSSILIYLQNYCDRKTGA